LGDGKALAHGSHTLQHWNQWLSQSFLGKKLLETEAGQFSHLLKQHYGKHAVLLGVPHQYDLLATTKIPCHSLITPLTCKENKPGYIEGNFQELPLLSGSVDLVLLPHTQEFTDNPRQFLSEACRIIKPEGLIAITGFNPVSPWGLRKFMTRNKKDMPWAANFISAQKMVNWLRLSDFVLEKQEYTLFTPPINHSGFYHRLSFLEKFGISLLGGAYLLIARAKVIPLTPIRLKWKQQLSSIRMTGTMPPHIARQSK